MHVLLPYRPFKAQTVFNHINMYTVPSNIIFFQLDHNANYNYSLYVMQLSDLNQSLNIPF